MLCIPGFLTQCFLQVSLVGSARPSSNDDIDKNARVLSLNMGTTMRPEGEYARKPAIVVAVQPNSFQQNRSSLLQSAEQPKGPGVDEELDQNQSLASSQDSSLSGSVSSLESDVEPDSSVKNEAVASSEKPVDEPVKKEEASLAEPIENAVALADGEEVKLFRDASGKVDEMENSASQMKEKLEAVNDAWGTVDGKLTQYKGSIEELATQFRKLDDASKGIHDEVKSDFKNREKLRMCSFINAKKVLNGEPKIDCSTMEEVE